MPLCCFVALSRQMVFFFLFLFNYYFYYRIWTALVLFAFFVQGGNLSFLYVYLSRENIIIFDTKLTIDVPLILT